MECPPREVSTWGASAWGGVCPIACWDTRDPPMNRMTDRCKNITLFQILFAGGKNHTLPRNRFHVNFPSGIVSTFYVTFRSDAGKKRGLYVKVLIAVVVAFLLGVAIAVTITLVVLRSDSSAKSSPQDTETSVTKESEPKTTTTAMMTGMTITTLVRRFLEHFGLETH